MLVALASDAAGTAVRENEVYLSIVGLIEALQILARNLIQTFGLLQASAGDEC